MILLRTLAENMMENLIASAWRSFCDEELASDVIRNTLL